jgi:hypothetical protein
LRAGIASRAGTQYGIGLRIVFVSFTASTSVIVWSLFEALIQEPPSAPLCSGHRPIPQTRSSVLPFTSSVGPELGRTSPIFPHVRLASYGISDLIHYTNPTNWQANLSLPLLTKKSLRPAE